MKNNIRAFTLIELVVVVSVIALLASFAIPSYLRYTRDARRVEALNLMSGIHSAQSEFFVAHNGFTADINQLIFDPPAIPTFYIYNLCDNMNAANVRGDGLKMNGPGGMATGPLTGAVCSASSLRDSYTAHANGQIDGDNFVDNIQISQTGEICEPGTCNSVTWGAASFPGGVIPGGLTYCNDSTDAAFDGTPCQQ